MNVNTLNTSGINNFSMDKSKNISNAERLTTSNNATLSGTLSLTGNTTLKGTATQPCQINNQIQCGTSGNDIFGGYLISSNRSHYTTNEQVLQAHTKRVSLCHHF